MLGQKFVVQTDQKALKFLLKQHVIQTQHQKWISKLLGFYFEVKYKPGAENKVADALSRVPPTIHLAALSALALLDVQIVCEEVEKDPKLNAIIQRLQLDDHSVP